MPKRFLMILTIVSTLLLAACEQPWQEVTVEVLGLNGELTYKHSFRSSGTHTATEDGIFTILINYTDSFVRPDETIGLPGLSPLSFSGYIEVLSQPDQQSCLGSYFKPSEIFASEELPVNFSVESDYGVYCVDDMIPNLAVTDNNLAALIQLIATRENWTAASDVTYIRGTLSIKSLDGLEELPSLRRLDLFSPGLEGADISRLTELTELTDLSISYQIFLQPVDLSRTTKLENLVLSSTNIDIIDLSHNSRLVSLQMDDNQLPNIDISNNTLLTELNLRDNKLSTIDVSQNVNLQNINLSFNNLTDISSLLALPNVQMADLDGDEIKNSQIPCAQLDALAARIGSGLIRPPFCIE